MSLISRIIDLIKANINALLSGAENPEKMINQAIMEMNTNYLKAKNQVASTIADKKRLEKQYSAAHSEVKKWEDKAKLAISRNEEALAREALKRKGEASKLAEGYKKQLDLQSVQVDKLKSSLQQLKDKIEEAKRKRTLLLARDKRATAQAKIQKTMSSMSDDSAFALFDRMEEKVNEKEARIDATLEIEDTVENGLENQFAALESTDIDDELAALKADMASGKTTSVSESEVDDELALLRQKMNEEGA
jgi:phage shock protein A